VLQPQQLLVLVLLVAHVLVLAVLQPQLVQLVEPARFSAISVRSSISNVSVSSACNSSRSRVPFMCASSRSVEGQRLRRDHELELLLPVLLVLVLQPHVLLVLVLLLVVLLVLVLLVEVVAAMFSPTSVRSSTSNVSVSSRSSSLRNVTKSAILEIHLLPCSGSVCLPPVSPSGRSVRAFPSGSAGFVPS
jgi:hypothetical protein